MWSLKKANISALAIHRSTTSEKVSVVFLRSHRTLQAGGTRRRFRLTTGLQMLTWRIVGRVRSALQENKLQSFCSWCKNRAATWTWTINTNLVLEEIFFVSVFLVFMSAWRNNTNKSICCQTRLKSSWRIGRYLCSPAVPSGNARTAAAGLWLPPRLRRTLSEPDGWPAEPSDAPPGRTERHRSDNGPARQKKTFGKALDELRVWPDSQQIVNSNWWGWISETALTFAQSGCNIMALFPSPSAFLKTTPTISITHVFQ